MLSEVRCDEVEDGEESETLMKSFAIKTSISEMVSLWKRGEKTEGVKLFLARGCREYILVFKDDVGSVDSFGREAQE